MPDTSPISSPKFEPGEGQRDRVERAEDQADRGLAAHEARDRVVHLAREAAHRLAVLQRDPVVDRRTIRFQS